MKTPAIRMPSELTLDKYLIGEATPAEIAGVKQWLQSDQNAGKLLEHRKLQAQNSFSLVPTFDVLADRIASHTKRVRQNSISRTIFTKYRPALAWLSLLLIAAPAVFLLFNRAIPPLTAKGEANNYGIIKRGSSIVKFIDTAHCRAGDTIQLFIVSNRTCYVMAYYSENGGTLTPCSPHVTSIDTSASSASTPLPFSLVIDSTTGPLEIAIVTSQEPFSIETGIEFLRKKGKHDFERKRFTIIPEKSLNGSQ